MALLTRIERESFVLGNTLYLLFFFKKKEETF
jgi:hypothetical protein